MHEELGQLRTSPPPTRDIHMSLTKLTATLLTLLQKTIAYSPELPEYARHPSELVLLQCTPLLSVITPKSVLQSRTRERNGALRLALKFSPPTLAYPLPSQLSNLYATRGAPKGLPRGHAKVKTDEEEDRGRLACNFGFLDTLVITGQMKSYFSPDRLCCL